MSVGGGDDTLARLHDRAAAPASDLYGDILDVLQRGTHGSLVRAGELPRGLLVAGGEQHRYGLRRTEGEVEADDLRLAGGVAQPALELRVGRVDARHQRVERARVHLAGKPERGRPAADPLAGRLTAPGVVIVATLRDLTLVVGGLPGRQLA